jgi:hypothetical protein
MASTASELVGASFGCAAAKSLTHDMVLDARTGPITRTVVMAWIKVVFPLMFVGFGVLLPIAYEHLLVPIVPWQWLDLEQRRFGDIGKRQIELIHLALYVPAWPTCSHRSRALNWNRSVVEAQVEGFQNHNLRLIPGTSASARAPFRKALFSTRCSNLARRKATIVDAFEPLAKLLAYHR